MTQGTSSEASSFSSFSLSSASSQPGPICARLPCQRRLLTGLRTSCPPPGPSSHPPPSPSLRQGGGRPPAVPPPARQEHQASAGRRAVSHLLHGVPLYPLLRTRHSEEPAGLAGNHRAPARCRRRGRRAPRAGLLGGGGGVLAELGRALHLVPTSRSWPSSVPVGRRGAGTWPGASGA